MSYESTVWGFYPPASNDDIKSIDQAIDSYRDSVAREMCSNEAYEYEIVDWKARVEQRRYILRFIASTHSEREFATWSVFRHHVFVQMDLAMMPLDCEVS